MGNFQRSLVARRRTEIPGDECPDEIRCARHRHEFHGVKMNKMIRMGGWFPIRCRK